MATTDFKNTVTQAVSRHLLFEPDEEKTWLTLKNALQSKLGGWVEIVRGEKQQGVVLHVFEVIHKTASEENRLEVVVRRDRIITNQMDTEKP